MQRLERKHLPLRTRLKRLTRKTICFSKKTVLSRWPDYLTYRAFLLLTIYTSNTRPNAGSSVVSNGPVSGFAGAGTAYIFSVTPTMAGTVTTVNLAANQTLSMTG